VKSSIHQLVEREEQLQIVDKMQFDSKDMDGLGFLESTNHDTNKLNQLVLQPETKMRSSESKCKTSLVQVDLN
jgi:hypothetical protein